MVWIGDYADHKVAPEWRPLQNHLLGPLLNLIHLSDPAAVSHLQAGRDGEASASLAAASTGQLQPALGLLQNGSEPSPCLPSIHEVDDESADGTAGLGHAKLLHRDTAGQPVVKLLVTFPARLHLPKEGCSSAVATSARAASSGENRSTLDGCHNPARYAAAAANIATSTNSGSNTTWAITEDAGAAAVADWSGPLEQVCRRAAAGTLPEEDAGEEIRCCRLKRVAPHRLVVEVPVVGFRVSKNGESKE